MIRNAHTLPPLYGPRATIDLKEDRRAAITIQVIFVAIAVTVFGLALVFKFPLSSDLDTWVSIVVTIVACLFYMAAHELTHAGFLWLFSRVRPAITLRFPYLTVGGRGYLNRRSFLIVALAPVIIWGIALVALLVALPPEFFFAVYIVAILNFAGSAGDYLQAYAVAKQPRTALIQDDGRVTTVYLPAEHRRPAKSR